jgi:hypothetical protein
MNGSAPLSVAHFIKIGKRVTASGAFTSYLRVVEERGKKKERKRKRREERKRRE